MRDAGLGRVPVGIEPSLQGAPKKERERYIQGCVHLKKKKKPKRSVINVSSGLFEKDCKHALTPLSNIAAFSEAPLERRHMILPTSEWRRVCVGRS